MEKSEAPIVPLMRGQGVVADEPGRPLLVRALPAARALAASPALVWSLVVVAVALRTIRFFAERSLWLDESYLTLNLMSRSYGGLVGQLDFNQGGPVGWLFLEKATMQVFGDSERALRLPSFLAGIVALALFVRLAQRYLPRTAVPVAVFLFAVLEPFVYYSAETKQYGFDVLATVGLLALFARVLDRPLSLGDGALLAGVGAVAVWFSHPSAFVLAGYGIVATAAALRRRDTGDLVRQAGVYAVWLLSFGIEYVVSIRHLDQLRVSIVGDGRGGGHGSLVTGLVKSLYTISSDPGQEPRTLVGLFAFVVLTGTFVVARRNLLEAGLLVAPVAVAFGAGLFHRYPISQRFIVFLLPIAVALASAGIAGLVAATRRELKLAVALALGALLLVPPAVTAARHAVRPPDPEAMRPLLDDVSEQWRQGDVLYLLPYSQYAFRYYLRCHDCNPGQARERALWPFSTSSSSPQSAAAVVSHSRALDVGTVGRAGLLTAFRNDLGHLAGRPRVWVLMTHYYPLDLASIDAELDRLGTRLSTVTRGTAVLYLYDLRAKR